MKINEYDDIPVLYCKDCLSLRIESLFGEDYCPKCSSTNIGEADIEEWDKMYESTYGKKFLSNKK